MTDFLYTGAVQYYLVPDDCTQLDIVCKGAQGDATGKGGSATGTLTVTPGETLKVYVGHRGSWNGGGSGYIAPGGGASDVRRGGAALENRKIVAGGGGGGNGTTGGRGGGTSGDAGTGTGAGGGGTQTAGGAAGGTGATAGSLGIGGDSASTDGYGGGGGFYGGGGSSASTGGGGGGSGYIGGVSSGVLTVGGWDGNGFVSINPGNEPPNAPTLNSPIGGVSIASNTANTFKWTFSDVELTDTQSAYDLRYRVGTGAWTTVSGTTAAERVFAANTFTANTSYEWQARTADALGIWGPFSASGLFSAYATPAAPAITAPANASTVASPTYEVTWTVTNQAAYQLRTVADNAGAADTNIVYTNTGTVAVAAERKRVIAFAVNGRYEHVQMRVYFNGLWSPWASNRVLVSYAVPAPPAVVVTGNDALGYISVAGTQPTPTTPEPVVSYVDILRSQAGDGAYVPVAYPAATNYITHPSFELGAADALATGWTKAGTATGTPTYSKPAGRLGGVAQQAQYTAPATDDVNKTLYFHTPSSAVGSFAAGDAAVFSFYAKGTSTGTSLKLLIYAANAAGASIGSAISAAITLTADWQRYSVIYASLPANTSLVRGYVYFDAIISADVIDITVDDANIIKSGTLSPYFNGTTPASVANSYAWTGTANASTSTRGLKSLGLWSEPVHLAKDLAPTTTYKDYAVASGVTYAYIERAVGTTGTKTDSPLMS